MILQLFECKILKLVKLQRTLIVGIFYCVTCFARTYQAETETKLNINFADVSRHRGRVFGVGRTHCQREVPWEGSLWGCVRRQHDRKGNTVF